jgi:hypothetical protein
LSRKVTAIVGPDCGVTLDWSNFIRHIHPLGSRSRKDAYMRSVYTAIAVYWHPTVGQLCVPEAGPDTRKRDQLRAAVRRNRQPRRWLRRRCHRVRHTSGRRRFDSAAERATTATIRSNLRRTRAFGAGRNCWPPMNCADRQLENTIKSRPAPATKN